MDNYFLLCYNRNTWITIRKNKMDIVDIDKLRAQYNAGLSIRKLSIMWNLPYASLYRALKKVEGE